MYLVMELIDGRTLKSIIEEEAPLKPTRAGRFAEQLVAGLAEAHHQGFVHRDLKPGNIMVMNSSTGVEQIKILDFGIVASLSSLTDADRLTKTGYIVGTPTYMAPEQVDPKAVSPQADVYALGVILYELLAGQPPFNGSLEQILVAKMTEAPAPIPQAGELGNLVMSLLDSNPARRPQNALHVSAELSRLSLLNDDPATVRADAVDPTAPELPTSGAVRLIDRTDEAPLDDREPNPWAVDTRRSPAPPAFEPETHEQTSADTEPPRDPAEALPVLYESDTDTDGSALLMQSLLSQGDITDVVSPHAPGLGEPSIEPAPDQHQFSDVADTSAMRQQPALPPKLPAKVVTSSRREPKTHGSKRSTAPAAPLNLVVQSHPVPEVDSVSLLGLAAAEPVLIDPTPGWSLLGSTPGLRSEDDTNAPDKPTAPSNRLPPHPASIIAKTKRIVDPSSAPPRLSGIRERPVRLSGGWGSMSASRASFVQTRGGVRWLLPTAVVLILILSAFLGFYLASRRPVRRLIEIPATTNISAAPSPKSDTPHH